MGLEGQLSPSVKEKKYRKEIRNKEWDDVSAWQKGHRTSSYTHSKTKPSPMSLAPQERWFASSLSGARSGINTLRALTHACRILHWERLAKGLEGCFISSSKFPIIYSSIHCEEHIGRLRWSTLCGRCTTEWMHGQMKWICIDRCWQYTVWSHILVQKMPVWDLHHAHHQHWLENYLMILIKL